MYSANLKTDPDNDESAHEQPQRTAALNIIEQDGYPWTYISDDGFKVTAHCNEPTDDEEEESSPQTLADRYQREHLPDTFFRASDQERDHVTAARERFYRHPPASQVQLCRRRGLRNHSPSRVEIANVGDTEDRDVLAPHARFFIKREKSVISIHFEPSMYDPPLLPHR